MVLKMFTYFEHPSVGLLYLLKSHFDEVWISKPSCSRASNAETYLVAKGV
jgi:23S rRNA U2552 (ribose-2'-O)-methylase RlmE/FtsJ